MPTDDLTTQLAIWGYAITGHDPLALYIAEHPDLGSAHGWWDRTAQDLANERVSDGGAWQRVPDHWALAGKWSGR